MERRDSTRRKSQCIPHFQLCISLHEVQKEFELTDQVSPPVPTPLSTYSAVSPLDHGTSVPDVVVDEP